MKLPRCWRKVTTPKGHLNSPALARPHPGGVPCAGLLPVPGGQSSHSLETLAPHPHVTRETQRRHQSPPKQRGGKLQMQDRTEPWRAAGETAREMTWRRRRRSEGRRREGTGVLSDHSTRPRLLQSELPEKDRAGCGCCGSLLTPRGSSKGCTAQGGGSRPRAEGSSMEAVRWHHGSDGLRRWQPPPENPWLTPGHGGSH